MSTPTPADRAKYAAALRAADYVESGMKVGLGTGSTAAWLVRIIAQRVRDEGLQVLCVPTSTATAALAEELGITLITLEEAGRLDLTIDGADEVDGDLTLIKGGGAALLHEKIVATASDRMIVIADDAKAVQTLGAFPLPVEIIRFGAASTIAHVRDLLAELDIRGDVVLRGGNDPVLTDEGNYILDLHLGEIEHPAILAGGLNQIAGVVENGLFVGICDAVVLGDSDGNVRLRDEKTGERTTLAVDPTPPANLFQGDAK